VDLNSQHQLVPELRIAIGCHSVSFNSPARPIYSNRAHLSASILVAPMLSATADAESATMSTASRKRPAEPDKDGADAKRQRVQPPSTILSLGPLGSSPHSSTAATTDELANKGLRRAIALALEKVGFDSAAPEAMESFAAMAETCMWPSICRLTAF
jgi:hypothetical protein